MTATAGGDCPRNRCTAPRDQSATASPHGSAYIYLVQVPPITSPPQSASGVMGGGAGRGKMPLRRADLPSGRSRVRFARRPGALEEKPTGVFVAGHLPSTHEGSWPVSFLLSFLLFFCTLPPGRSFHTCVPSTCHITNFTLPHFHNIQSHQSVPSTITMSVNKPPTATSQTQPRAHPPYPRPSSPTHPP